MLKNLRDFVLAVTAAPGLACAQIASADLNEGVAVYGPGVFPALTRVQLCGNYRILVAYLFGTDMLFVDEISPAENGSTFEVVRGYSFLELNQYHSSASIDSLECDLKAPDTLTITGKGSRARSEFEFSISLDLRSGSYRYADSSGIDNTH